MLKSIKFLFLMILLPTIIGCQTTSVKTTEDGRKVYSDKKDERLTKKDLIEGFVFDSKSRKPIENATIELKNANLGMGYYLVKTDSKGFYKVENFITKVKYIMDISANGYVPYKYRQEIRPGKLNFYLDREAVITGKVTDSSGKPMADTEVTLNHGYYYNRFSSTRPTIVKTDSEGIYKIDKLTRGSYFLSFRKGGYISETAGIRNIKKGETFKLQIKLYKPASISGEVKIKGINSPAINMDVTALGKYRHSVLTYHDGTYQLNDLKPGSYRIRLYHQGFHSFKSKVIYLKEGASLKSQNFQVVPKKPELNVYTYRYTFVPGSKVSFNLRTFRLEKVKASLYKVPLETYLKGRTDPNSLNIKKEKFSLIKSWDEPIHNFKPYRWKYQTLDLKEALPTGGYCVEVKGANKIISRKFFTITSTGVVVKRSSSSIFAYATNLITNKPVKGASIVVFVSKAKKKSKSRYRRSRRRRSRFSGAQRIEDLPVKIIKKGKTNRDGIFKFKLKSNSPLSALVVGKDNSYALCATGSPLNFEKEKNKYFIYTERPVYRSGDTVSYKIIGKSRKNRFVPLPGQKLYYRIRNRDRRNTVKEGTLKLDSWGTATGKIKIRPVSGLGEYEIRVGTKSNNLYSVGRFYVEQYRKPEFNVEITPSKDYFVNGESAEFRVVGKYFFGAPLKNAIVRYRFYETKLRDSDTKYWWEEDYHSRRSYNRIKLEGDKILDNNGITALRLDTGNVPYDREITVEATVIDKSNISITARKKVKIGRGAFYIKLNPKKNFYADNEKKSIEVKTLTHSGKPYGTKVKLKLYRYIWKPYQRVYVHDRRPLYETTVRTNSKGIGHINLPEKFSYYGEFDLIADGKDNRGNKIKASRVVWVYSKHGGPIKSKFKNLELSVDKTVVDKPGNITCLIKSRFSNAHVCLTLEGKDIYYSRVIKLKGNITPVTIPVKRSYAPNFYLTATMQRNRALFTQTSNISIPTAGTRLKISLKTDKEKYLPGEKATIRIKTTGDNNRPVSADVSLGAVDEAIYHIRRDHTPKMKNYFYTKISNWVLTNYSYPINILAGAAKEDKVKVRSDFRDTAFWKSNIKTDKKGMAKISFKLPDNITTWRLTSLGHDRAGKVGETKKRFSVTQDLIARIGKPRFFVEGDSIEVIGMVNSNTNKGLPDIKTEMMVNNKKVYPEKPVKISLPAYGSARSYYRFKVPSKKNSVDIQYNTRADSKRKDALKLSVPVKKRGASYALFGIGDMQNNRKVTLKPLKESSDFEFVPEKVKISLNPSPVIKMIKGTNFLINYPYGCVEQTTNRFLPLLAVQQLLKDKNVEYLIPEKKLKQIPAMTEKGIKKLERMQNSDGSWGWWSGDRGNEFISGYVMYGLYLSKSYGYKVSKTTIIRGLKAIKGMLDERYNKLHSNNKRAFLLYVYSQWGKWHTNAYKTLKGAKKKSTYEMAFTLKALSNYTVDKYSAKWRSELIFQALEGKKEEEYLTLKSKDLPQLRTELKQRVKKDSKGIFWTSGGTKTWGWPGAHTEITAHVLSALVASGDKTTMPAQIVNSLSKRNKGDSWVTTKQTASVILSICKFLKTNKVDLGKKVDVTFKMGNKKLTTIGYDPSRVKTTDELIQEINLNSFDPKKEIIIDAEGTGSSDVTYDIEVKGTLYFKPSGMFSIFKSEGNSLDDLTNGIQIHRSYSEIKRVRDMHNAEYMVPQPLEDEKRIKIGDELLVKLKFTAQDDFEYLMLEDYLPSGFEVVKENAYDIYKPYVHSERWDNKMAFFFNNLKKGKVYEIAYIIRGELPGKFFVKPAKMECMYEPSIQGWTVPLNIDIKKPKK